MKPMRKLRVLAHINQKIMTGPSTDSHFGKPAALERGKQKRKTCRIILIANELPRANCNIHDGIYVKWVHINSEKNGRGKIFSETILRSSHGFMLSSEWNRLLPENLLVRMACLWRKCFFLVNIKWNVKEMNPPWED